MVCGAKRIRSLYLPWITAVTLKLSATAPPKDLASFSTINDAITPRRDVFAEQTSLPPLTHRGWKPLPHNSKLNLTVYIKTASSPKVAKTGYRFASCAWMAVMATVLTMSVTVQPRLRSFTGLLRPCNTGPTATALAERCTAL